MTSPSPIAARLLAYLKAESGKGPIPWQKIAEAAGKSGIRLVKDSIAPLANELKSLGYPIHSTKDHEYYYGESEMFEGKVEKSQIIERAFEREFESWRA